MNNLSCSVPNSSMGSENQVVVVDVSSDEEVDTRRLHIDEFDWLNDAIEAVDGKSDSTDLVEVLSEIKGSIDSKYRKPNSSIQAVDIDEDCVILDGDPDKSAKTTAVDVDDKFSKNVDDDDDVLVVGQKGEIACRDFPHPRHSCAKFSYNSTSHEKYCDMCHCYVCDIRAPCPYWCISFSSTDHCHANDKSMTWRNQREYFRTGIMPTQRSAKPSSKVTRRPTQNIIRLSHNNTTQNHVGIRPCSSSTCVGDLSNPRARFRVKQLIQHNHSRQINSLNSVRKSFIQKDTSSYMSNQRSLVRSSGTRYGATNGSSINAGVYTNAQVPQSNHHSSSVVAPTIHPTNAQVSQSNHHSSSVVAPTIHPGMMYTQHQRNYSPVTVSQNNVYTSHSGQNISGSGNCQFQANGDLFSLPETLLDSAVSQAETVQEQPGTTENVLQTKLSEFESWLMDSSNQTGLVSTLHEPVGRDCVSSLTFDFESFLND